MGVKFSRHNDDDWKPIIMKESLLSMETRYSTKLHNPFSILCLFAIHVLNVLNERSDMYILVCKIQELDVIVKKLNCAGVNDYVSLLRVRQMVQVIVLNIEWEHELDEGSKIDIARGIEYIPCRILRFLVLTRVCYLWPDAHLDCTLPLPPIDNPLTGIHRFLLGHQEANPIEMLNRCITRIQVSLKDRSEPFCTIARTVFVLYLFITCRPVYLRFLNTPSTNEMTEKQWLISDLKISSGVFTQFIQVERYLGRCSYPSDDIDNHAVHSNIASIREWCAEHLEELRLIQKQIQLTCWHYIHEYLTVIETHLAR
jgi:hypothetical protein